MAKPEFSTTEYEFAHGRKPRGPGHWAFFFDNDPNPFFCNGTFSKAKAEAVAEARKRGATSVKVGS